MKKLSYEQLLSIRHTTETAKQAERYPISLILDNIRSAYNVGSIFRTADSALATEVILTGYTPRPPKKEVLKTALGATESVPWRYFESPAAAVKSEQKAGKKVFALEITDDSRSYSDYAEDDFPLSIVLGNELTGVNDEVLQACDGAVEIPMYGVKHSLNVGVSAGIALFEAVKIYMSLTSGKP